MEAYSPYSIKLKCVTKNKIQISLQRNIRIFESSLDSVNNDKYIFIYFWSTTCAPCIEDLKNLTSIANKYKDKVEFIGICDVRSDLNSILTSNQVNWPNLVLQKSSIKQKDYDIYKYPTSYLLNKNHIVEKMDIRSEELRIFLELN